MGAASESFSSVSGVRRRVLTAVGALVVVTLLSSALGLFRITHVNRKLEAIHAVGVPLSRAAARLQSDGDLFARELSKRLGLEARQDAHRKQRSVPPWARDLVRTSISGIDRLVHSEEPWAERGVRKLWRDWADNLRLGLDELEERSQRLAELLARQGSPGSGAEEVSEAAARWHQSLELFQARLEWGAVESDRLLKQSFSEARSSVADVRAGLEAVLAVLAVLSLLLFWIGERALRPLGQLTQLARSIAERGGVFRKEDKVLLSDGILGHAGFSGSDEVSALGREFHRMATALMEREKSADEQRVRLLQSNQQLREVRDLNRDILSGIESPLVVTDLSGLITHANARAVSWLQAPDLARLTGTRLLVWPRLQSCSQLGAGLEAVRRGGMDRQEWKETATDSVFAARFFPLKQGDSGEVRGVIVVFDNLTEERRLAEQLRHAENLASIGRLSAQVAHEVRNPLHSIGLEAELALDSIDKGKPAGPQLKQALQSILTSVERLEGVTETYLKLARPGSPLVAHSGRGVSSLERVDLGDCLESALATYGPQLEASRIRVDWSRAGDAVAFPVSADGPTLEQAIGNLLKNSIEALLESKTELPEIRFVLERRGRDLAVLSLEDNGPGIPQALWTKLFTPFATGRAQGTGLGLAFVKKAIEDARGEVRAIQRVRGACFELKLPLAERSSSLFDSGTARSPEVNV